METVSPKLEESLKRAQPWVRRLLERDCNDTAWGFGIYYLPSVLEGAASLEEVQDKHDNLLDFAMRSVGCSAKPGMPYQYLQPMQWPIATSTSTSSETAQQHFVERLHAQAVVTRLPKSPNGVPLYDCSRTYAYDADATLLDTFRQLRKDFRQVRATRPVWHYTHLTTRNQPVEGLFKGLLDNVFLVVDEYSAWSWWELMPVDWSWVWAVDPDFDDSAVSAAGDGTSEVYKGYLKVRLQQLVGHFFEAREYQPQISLKTLWEAARQSQNCTFVSQDPDDYHTWTGDTRIGSALAPKNTPLARSRDDLTLN